jgi:tetratricopeptide (TPR) repeat protein
LPRRFLLSGVLFAASTLTWALSPAIQNPVLEDLSLGHADDALERLNAVLAQNPADAQAHNLRCRVYYQEELWDPAIEDCQAAVRLDPADSNDHLWLGRAYGLKAQHVSVLSGYKLAHKVADEFKKAVELDPRNKEALADLTEFDVEAPSVAGGGLSKAAAVVEQLQAVDPVAALTLEARITEARKDYAAAEADYKAAIAAGPRPSGPWMDLAAFYQRRKRIPDMVAAARNGVAADPKHGPVLVDAASALARAGVDQPMAIQWLQEYLNSHAQSEDAPAFAVRIALARLLLEQGDSAGAQLQLAAAHALASGYRIPGTNVASRGGL